jgi:signal transduction histidine kinase
MALAYYYFPTDKTLIQGWCCTLCEWKWMLGGATRIEDVSEMDRFNAQSAFNAHPCVPTPPRSEML